MVARPMTDKMPAEIWADMYDRHDPPGRRGKGCWFDRPTDPKKHVVTTERYIHEFHYKRLFEAYRKNRELLWDAPHAEGCPGNEGWPEYVRPCRCWKSEIEEVIELERETPQ